MHLTLEKMLWEWAGGKCKVLGDGSGRVLPKS